MIEDLLCLADPLLQPNMSVEITGDLIQVRDHCLHGDHAIGQQCHVLVQQAQSAVENTAQPMIERLGEPRSMAGLCHLRAAGQRMAGAIDLFGNGVRLGHPLLAFEVRADGRDVCSRLTGVDVTKYVIRAGLPKLGGRRCQ
jgi:hypothetical protein